MFMKRGRTASRHCYDYPRPMVSVDAVVFRKRSRRLEVLAVRRGRPPFKGMLALPGGFVGMDERLEEAARRELHEETGVRVGRLHQLWAFDEPGRDPRDRNISVAFVGAVAGLGPEIRGGDDASEALWISARRPPELAFDHVDIVKKALRWLKEHPSIAPD